MDLDILGEGRCGTNWSSEFTGSNCAKGSIRILVLLARLAGTSRPFGATAPSRCDV